MSGIDEQPKFPECPKCEGKRDFEFWVFGHTEAIIENGMEDNNEMYVNDYIYLDKNINTSRCTRTESEKGTHVLLPTTNHIDDNEIICEMAFREMLPKGNVVKCGNGHIYAPDSDVYNRVRAEMLHTFLQEGAKWE